MSLYAVDITFTDPEYNTRNVRYTTPTDFMYRFKNLEKDFERKSLAVRTDLTLTEEQKATMLEKLRSEYKVEKALHPTNDATHVQASIMTGKAYSFRKYESIQELEDELTRSRKAFIESRAAC